MTAPKPCAARGLHGGFELRARLALSEASQLAGTGYVANKFSPNESASSARISTPSKRRTRNAWRLVPDIGVYAFGGGDSSVNSDAI